MAVARFPLGCPAPRIRGRVRLQHLHDPPQSKGSEGKEGLWQGAEKP
jgi:hypothetical protein